MKIVNELIVANDESEFQFLPLPGALSASIVGYGFQPIPLNLRLIVGLVVPPNPIPTTLGNLSLPSAVVSIPCP